MSSRLFGLLLFLISTPSLFWAQGSFAWGIKGGLAIGNQRFNDGGTFNNGLLFKYHGDLYIENAPEDATSVIYAQAGLHVRGHARRFQRGIFFDPVSQLPREVPGFTQEFLFNNVGLILGFKRRGVLGKERAFYTIGLRGEYTVNTNLSSSVSSIYSLYFPTSEFVNKLNYGVSLSGGYEFPFSDLFGGFVEFSVHPDISRQYFQQAIPLNITDIFGNRITGIPEQSIRNLSFELTIGVRFLRKVEYVE